MSKSLDFNKLTFADMIEPRSGFPIPPNEPYPAQSITFPNFSAGALLYNHQYYVGFAAHNILEPNQSFYKSTASGAKLPLRLTIHGGYKIPLGKAGYVTPTFLVMGQRQFVQMNLGFLAGYKKFEAGVFFRQTRPNSDAAMFILGFKGKKFAAFYSYDVTVSDARVAATGSHELTLAYHFHCKKGGSGTSFRFHQ